MNHAIGQCLLYANNKGEEFWVLREDYQFGRFIKRSNGRRGYGKFWTQEGWRPQSHQTENLHFSRTAMNGRGGLVERLERKQ
jgi:hypothetical protein